MNAEIQGYRETGKKDTEKQEYKDTWMQKYKVTEKQEYNGTEKQEYQGSEILLLTKKGWVDSSMIYPLRGYKGIQGYDYGVLHGYTI